VDAHRIDVLDEADSDLLSLGVADDLQLQFFPAQNGFLDEDLVDEAGGQPPAGDRSQLLDVEDGAAAGAAHGVGRTDDDRVPELLRDLLRFVDAVGNLAARHLDLESRHRVLEGLAVLASLDGIDFHADDLDAVLIEHARGRQFGGEIEPGLAAEIGQQGIRPLDLDDLRDSLQCEGLDVRRIGHAGVGHDGGRVGVDQHDLVAERAQGLAGLGAAVVELTGLADHDRAGTDDQDFLDVGALGH